MKEYLRDFTKESFRRIRSIAASDCVIFLVTIAIISYQFGRNRDHGKAANRNSGYHHIGEKPCNDTSALISNRTLTHVNMKLGHEAL